MTNLNSSAINPNGQPASLLPCPFCGGEAELCVHEATGVSWVRCIECETSSGASSEAGAIATWNRRAAVELDDFFYLPKPKQQLFGITTGLSFDDLGIKATGTIDAYAFTDAVLNWQAELLNEKIVKRICEVWNPERTCHLIHDGQGWWECDSCGGSIDWDSCDPNDPPACNYCPNCGAKVVE